MFAHSRAKIAQRWHVLRNYEAIGTGILGQVEIDLHMTPHLRLALDHEVEFLHLRNYMQY